MSEAFFCSQCKGKTTLLEIDNQHVSLCCEARVYSASDLQDLADFRREEKRDEKILSRG